MQKADGPIALDIHYLELMKEWCLPSEMSHDLTDAVGRTYISVSREQ
jgi:hypothetical protein